LRRALNGNFWYLVVGNTISMFGSSIYLVAIVLYLKDVSESPVVLGLFQFLALLPTVALGPVLGAFVDRWRRRSVLIASDTARGLVMLSLFALSFTPLGLPPWLILLGAFGVGLCNAFFFPAVKAIVPDLVAPEQLRNANSIRSASVQISNMTGNAIGGILYVTLGTPLVLLFNGVAFLLSAVEERWIRLGEEKQSGIPLRRVFAEMRDGVRRVIRDRGLRLLVLANACILLLSPPVVLLLPFVVEDTLGLSASFVGYYFAGMLGGGIGGYALAAALPKTTRVERRLLIASFIGLTVALVASGVFLRPGVLAVSVVVAGGGIAVANLVLNTTLHRVVPQDERGRVFAIVESLSQASMPLAYLGSGFLIQVLLGKIQIVFLATAGVVAVLAVASFLSPQLRRLYQ
jgi:MFS family permease